MKKIIVLQMLVLIPSFWFLHLSAQISFVNYSTTNGLADDFVGGGVVVDASDVKWFGTENGLSKFDGTNWTNYTTSDGLIDNITKCIAADNSGNIWIGTEIGVSKFNGTSFQNFTTSEGLIDNSILYIAVDNSNNVWFGSFSGLSKYNGTDFTNYTTENGLSSNLISYILPDETKLFIGTWDSGLMIYDGTNFTVKNTDNGLLDNFVSSIETDSHGNIWIGSFVGITVLNSDLTLADTYTSGTELLNGFVQDIAIDANENVVVCEYADYISEGGVSFFNGTQWHTYGTTDGLVDKMVKRVKFDSHSFAWITTGTGVSKMSLGAESVENFILSQENIYPNPASDKIYISNLSDSFSYQIFDVFGRIVAQENSLTTDCVSVQTLNSGIYVLVYETNGITYSSRICRE